MTHTGCKFKPLDGFHTTLLSHVCGKTIWLDLDHADDLLDLLPEYDDWTTLAVYDGRVMEVVKAYNFCGRLVFDRGFEQTSKLSLPCGAYVAFILTRAGIESMACCAELFENCNK